MSTGKLRMGMVGGGQGAFIGTVHRMAATLDNEIELVCGAFSSHPDRSLASGRAWHIPMERCYPSFDAMMQIEAALPAEVRMHFVTIVTPNHMHVAPALAALQHGFHVVCDKPISNDIGSALHLRQVVQDSGKLFCLTHNYTGYPMVREARHIVRSGALGNIRKIVVEYPQGWLTTPLEASGQKQAAWRMDPAQSGPSCCLGDIGTHAVNLAEFISGLPIESVAADLSTFVPGRQLDDDASVLLRFAGGTKGILFSSQIAVSEENGLNIRLYGEHGGLIWKQEEPNTLIRLYHDRPREILRAGSNFGNLSTDALAHCRIPGGHPEGYLEGFANIYRNFALHLRAHLDGTPPPAAHFDFPSVSCGLHGLAFIQAALESTQNGSAWVTIPSL